MSRGLAAGAWADVRRLPEAFASFGEESVPQLAAGSSGKTAFLRLRFQRIDGRTRLVENFASGAQIVRNVMYLDTELNDMAVVFIQAVGAGILQGDRLRTEIIVGPGARVLVTPAAGTKAHRMEVNYATQRVDITVEQDAYAEILMDCLIPSKGVRLYTELNFVVDPSAVLLYQDHVTPGRVAHGEQFEYELLYTRMRGLRPDGRLLLADTTVLEPGRSNPTRAGVFGGTSDVGTTYIIAEAHSDLPLLAKAVHDSVQGLKAVSGGASLTPSGTGVHSRVLGASTQSVRAALHRSWETARAQLLGVGVPNIYQIKYGFQPLSKMADPPRSMS